MSMSGNFVYEPPSEFFHSLILLLFHNNCVKNKLAQKSSWHMKELSTNLYYLKIFHLFTN